MFCYESEDTSSIFGNKVPDFLVRCFDKDKRGQKREKVENLTNSMSQMKIDKQSKHDVSARVEEDDDFFSCVDPEEEKSSKPLKNDTGIENVENTEYSINETLNSSTETYIFYDNTIRIPSKPPTEFADTEWEDSFTESEINVPNQNFAIDESVSNNKCNVLDFQQNLNQNYYFDKDSGHPTIDETILDFQDVPRTQSTPFTATSKKNSRAQKKITDFFGTKKQEAIEKSLDSKHSVRKFLDNDSFFGVILISGEKMTNDQQNSYSLLKICGLEN